MSDEEIKNKLASGAHITKDAPSPWVKPTFTLRMGEEKIRVPYGQMRRLLDEKHLRLAISAKMILCGIPIVHDTYILGEGS